MRGVGSAQLSHDCSPFVASCTTTQRSSSYSIKNVLTVLCSALDYMSLDTGGGTAMAQWREMVYGEYGDEEKQQIGEDLLRYCELDTWAMGWVWEKLRVC